jgi:hypothetical protein
MWHTLQSAMSAIMSAIGAAWRTAFTAPDSDPSGPPTITKAAALREAARLSELVDAVAKQHAA